MELVNKQKARLKKGFHDSAYVYIIYLPMHAFGTGLVFHYLWNNHKKDAVAYFRMQFAIKSQL